MYSGSVIDKQKFHVIAYRSNPKNAFINNEDLTVSGIGMYSTLNIYPDMLTGYEIVCDMDMPLSVFARRNMLDKIQIPPEAMKAPRNTMMCDRTERTDEIPSEFVGIKKEALNNENNDQN